MLTLVKREIRDHVIYFIAAAVVSAILIALLAATICYFDEGEPAVYIGISLCVIVILVLGSAAMGVSQMYTDRNRKISAFLSALPVTRNQILAARIITGILAILTVFFPLMLAVIVLCRLLPPPILIFADWIPDIFLTAFLIGFACYCIGLQTGWNAGRLGPALGELSLTCFVVSLVLIKGFGPHIMVILLLFIVASLVRTWCAFTSTSL